MILIKFIKFHGLFKGILRFYVHLVEIIFFDIFYCVNTRISYFKTSNIYKNFKSDSQHYQPCGWFNLKKTFEFLKNNINKREKICIIDMGCGFGKPLIIGYFVFKNFNCHYFGVEFNKFFKKQFNKNLAKYTKKNSFINSDILKIKNFKFSNFDTIIITYMNILKNNKHNLKEFKKKIFKFKVKKLYFVSINPECITFNKNFLIFNLISKLHKICSIKLYKLR